MNGGWFAWAVLATAAFFTAFYMFRLVYLTFYGKERFDTKHVHPHEAPKTMTIPLMALAFLSAVGGFLGIPHVFGHFHVLDGWFEPVFADASRIIMMNAHHSAHPAAWVEVLFMLISIAVALSAIYLARKFYSDENWTVPRKLAKNFKGVYNLLLDKYRLDNLYYKVVIDLIYVASHNFLWKVFDVRVIDGFVNGSAKATESGGELVRKIQSGIVQNYALLMFAGIVIIIGWLLLSL